jgi:hypothetical protein
VAKSVAPIITTSLIVRAVAWVQHKLNSAVGECQRLVFPVDSAITQIERVLLRCEARLNRAY